MLVTKREVKQTSKKLLSVLLALVMIMTSMSVCFGTFMVSAEDVDYIGKLADYYKNSDYANTITALSKITMGGSGKSRTATLEGLTYNQFVQGREILETVHYAMQQTADWAKTENTVDQQATCQSSTTLGLYKDLVSGLEKKQVTITSEITNFLKAVFQVNANADGVNGATLHAAAVDGKTQGEWKNTVTMKTSDIKGYLAQAGKAANVKSGIDMSVEYVVRMNGDVYYEVAQSGACASNKKYYHHMIWPSEYGISAPKATSTDNTAKAAVDAHIAELNSFSNITFAQLLEMASAGSIDNKVAEYNTAKANAITYCGSQSTYDSLYADYKAGIDNFLTSVESAKAFQEYMPTVDAWNDFVDANPDYGVFQYDNFGAAGSATQVKLLDDFATFKAYRDYLLTGGSIYDYLVDYRYIDETYYTNFYDNVVAYDLQASKDKADALYLKYSVSNPSIDGEELAPGLEEKNLVYSELCGYINAINSYSAQVVNAVYYDGYAYLIDLREMLKCDINAAVLYFAGEADKTFTTLSTAALWAKIDEAKAKNADLTALYNDVKANVGEARANELLSAIRASATNMIENLYKTLADRFTLEVNNAWDVYVELGKPTALKVDSFLKLSAVMVAIEPDILTDLQAAGKAGYITQTTIDRYNELMKVGGIYEIWNAYATTFGFPDYEQTQIKYDDRIPMEGDELKTANDPVTEAEMNNLIAALDKIITSDLVGDLLGGLLNPDAEAGAEFNLGAMLTDLIKGALFTDDFINTVVKLLYPLVLNEFNKVWATLPNSVEYSGLNVKVIYEKSLHDILDAGNFEIYPDLLAQKLVDLGYGTKYADNIAALRAAGGEKDSWESSAIVDYENDEKLKLSWGVADKKAELEADGNFTDADQEAFEKFFYQAFEDATAGLLPLLTTLITNVAWAPDGVKRIAAGTANLVLYNVVLEVDLQLGSTANQGYANMLVPIYELLGVDYTPVSNINGSTDVAYVLEQILKPIFSFLGDLGEAPVDKILSVLPNLVYAFAFRMAKPMLNMLQTQITYDASTSLTGSVMADGAEVKVGDMLIGYEDDKMLDEGMFVGGLNSLLEFFGLSIPAIDQATLATLGKLDKIDTSRAAYIYSGLEDTGKAYSITADKADVGYYLLQYILGAVKDEAALTSLLGLFMVQKDENGEPILNAAGEKIPDEEAMAGIKEVIYETLNLDEMNVGNVIAAIVELANQVEYDVGEYYWYDGSKSTPIGTTSAAEIYLNPNNDWTEDKAEYLYNNLEALLTSILTMAKLDLDKSTEEVDGSIEGALEEAIGGLLTNKTVTALAKLLGSLSDLNALLAGGEAEEDANAPETLAEGEEEAGLAIDINKIIKDELDIDLSVYAQYKDLAEDEEIDFGVTDADSFVAALTDLLAPLKPLLDFILAGKDLTLIDSAITLQGYKGYDNAIIPLLEALGAAPAAYTDGADTLALTLNGLVGVINKLTTNDPAVEKDGAIYTIIDLLPGIIYYISSNALSQGVDKLLTPVYAILDTIRPIYNLKLNDLLAGIEVDFDKDGVKEPLNIDIKNLDWAFIFGLLNDLLGLDLSALKQVIYDVAKDIGDEYDSVSTLESTWKKGAYSTTFSQADMLTVVLSFVLEWITVPANGAKLDEMLGTDGIVASIGSVFESVEITYGTPNWMYWFDSEEAFDAYIASGAGLPNTLAAIDWENIGDNDWDLDTAKYFAENIDELVDLIIGMINEGKTDEEGNALPNTLAALLSGLVNGLVNADMINELVGMITGLLGDIDENLINAAGYLLDVDLAGLKAYTCEAEIKTISDFINELANVLDTYAGRLINWLFFGDDYRFAKKSDNTDTIVINGGLGYEKGLAMILEALGCELPAEANTKSVLGALATRVDEILADPVDEVIGLLPNLVYFLNANGAGVAVSNLLAPVYALLDKLSAFGLEVNLNDLIGIDLANLSLANIVEIVEGATDLPLDAAEAILVNFCTGKIEKGEYIYKMSTTPENTITILLVVALNLVTDDAFAAKLGEMLGTDIIAGLKEVFAGSEIKYEAPEWDYATNNKYGDYLIQYPNNWNKDTAAYVTEILLSKEFDALIASLIEGGKYETLGALLTDKVNVFTSANLQTVVDAITNLLAGIDEGLLEAAGVLLGADVVGLKDYTVPEGITTVDAFAAELANVLNKYAKGLVEWFLLGDDYTFFLNGSVEAPVDIITISGAEGYANGLALLLEALGCKNLPAATGETEAIVTGVLTSLAARISEILANPVVEVVNLLPNLVYFLNTNGVAAVVDNTLAAITALLDKLAVFGLNVDIKALVDLKSLMGLEDTDAAISLDNLSMEDVLVAVGYMVGLDLTEVKSVLVGFDLGAVAAYTSVSDAEAVGTAKKMAYSETFAKKDMVTVVANLVLLTLADEANAEFLKGLVGEDIYEVIVNILNVDSFVPDVLNMNWQFTSEETGGNKVGESMTAIETSELFKDFTYGDIFTKEMADYIAENFGTFVDNIIYLLGIEMDGETYESLSEILKELVGENVYNSANVVAIQDAIAGLLEGIANLEVNGVAVGGYIVEVLKKSLDVDITAVAAVKVPEFTKDKDKFVQYLAEVLAPLSTVLKWLLTDEDIAFFVKEGKTDLIKLPGAEGYKTGLVLLLEALGCEGIEAPDALKNMTGTDMVIAIIDPLLNKVNEILDDPAEELLAVLPNLIYFINSNGVDVVVKNTLNAVCTLLEAISPIADIDLDSLIYDLVGLSLDELTTEKLIDMLLKDLEIAGFKFTGVEVNDIVGELSVGVLKEYTSLSHENPAYQMVYDTESGSADEGDMVTVVLRFVIEFISTENNKAVLIDLLQSLGMSEETEKYVAALFDFVVTCVSDTQLGMETALYAVYYIYYGVDLGAEEIVTGKKDLDTKWQEKLADLSKDASSEDADVGKLITDIFDILFNDEGAVPPDGGNDVLDKDGLASNGFLSFFQRIKIFFEEIAAFFRELFSFGK